MPGEASGLTGYLPDVVLRRCTVAGSPREALDRFPAALLFADISGFTGLTERFSRRGPEGAEALTALLNGYFGQLIERVAAHGGDVLKFAGDAVLALWPARDGALSEATLRAVGCALEVQRSLDAFEVAPGIRLSMRVAVGAGEVLLAHLGGALRRREYVAAGDPLVQVVRIERHTAPGQVAVSAEVRALLEPLWPAVSASQGDGILPRDFITPTLEFQHFSDLPLPPAGEGRGEGGRACTTARRAGSSQADFPTPTPEAAVREYLPGAIRARLEAGQSDWLAEHRRVTVLFVQLTGLEQHLRTGVEEAQAIVLAAQDAVYRFEGSLNKLMVDDKGASLLAVFGLPPLAHEDDAVRGVQAALLLREKLGARGLACAIGVATGQAFCGTVGNERRREYTVMGHVVNLAARLMKASGDGILCDETTARAAESRLVFHPGDALQLRGLRDVERAFRPRAPLRVAATARSAMLGRPAELSALEHRIDALRNGESGLVLIEGEPGIGKSRLMEELRRRADAAGVRVLCGAGDAIDRCTPYHGWRDVFCRFFGIDDQTEPESRRARVLSRLGPHPAWLPLAPLLNAVFPLALPENELTSSMAGPVRSENLTKLLRGLLELEATTNVLLIQLEDVHWLDSASWALALQVAQRVRPVLLVLASRPLEDDVPPDAQRLLDQPGIVRIELRPLARDEVGALIRQRLAVADVPAALVDLVFQKAEGNPFFSEELACALREVGFVAVEEGECRLAVDPGRVEDLHLPLNLHGAIISRIDRLSPAQQLTLKVASVIGRVFSFRTLSDVHPVSDDRPHLRDCLEVLRRLDLTPLEAREPELSYIFKHIITQEVAYGLMLFSQRRLLHRTIAEWYERTSGDLAPCYPVIAHHWLRAEVPERAREYLDRAGDHALGCGAYHEAVRFLSQAQKIDEEARQDDGMRAARRHRQLGEAWAGLGRLPEALQSLEAALMCLGSRLPRTSIALLLALLWQALVQTAHRLLPARFIRPAGADSERLLETAKIFSRLAEIFYVDNRKNLTLFTVVTGLNLSERVGPCPEQARSGSNMVLGCGVVGSHRLARLYGVKALEASEACGDVPARLWVTLLIGMYDTSVGNGARALPLLHECIAGARRMGDMRRWDESMATLGILLNRLGQPRDALRVYRELYESARSRGVVESSGWGLGGMVEALSVCGDPTREVAELEAMIERENRHLGGADRLQCLGGLAIGLRRIGALDRALVVADAISEITRSAAGLAHYALQGYTAAAEVYLEAMEREVASSGRVDPGLRRSARQACAALMRVSVSFTVGYPSAWRCRGWLLRLSGRKRAARRAFHRGIDVAVRLGMRYEEALLRLELAGVLTGEARAAEEARAAALLARVRE